MLKLGNHQYEIIKVDVKIRFIPTDVISIELLARSKDTTIDSEIREVVLSADFVALDLFITNHTEINIPHGLINTIEFEPITQSIVDIIELDKFHKHITLHWHGLCDINWNQEFGKNVPFDTEISTYYTI